MNSESESHPLVPRQIPEGRIPLVSFEGSAYDCGRQYAEYTLSGASSYFRYLKQAHANWAKLSREHAKLFEKHAPFIPDIYRGLLDGCPDIPSAQATPHVAAPGHNAATPLSDECTAFGISKEATLDGEPISGQTKDTPIDSATLYIVLRMRITGGPTILVLAYPGELLGYGMWSTGMSVFRNSLHSDAPAQRGLSMEQWGLLALAGSSVEHAAALAEEHGIAGTGNVLLSDPTGQSINVEFNAGGTNIIQPRQSIVTHANHPVGTDTSPRERYPHAEERINSRYRMDRLHELLMAEHGRLTAQKTMMCLADHGGYPRGLCRHKIGDTFQAFTTAAIVAEPTQGRLTVTRGNPCQNWATCYTVD